MWHAEAFGSVQVFVVGLENTWNRPSDMNSTGVGCLPSPEVVAIRYAVGLDERHIYYPLLCSPTDGSSSRLQTWSLCAYRSTTSFDTDYRLLPGNPTWVATSRITRCMLFFLLPALVFPVSCFLMSVGVHGLFGLVLAGHGLFAASSWALVMGKRSCLGSR